MITYLVKTITCSLLLWLVYRFLLQREKMYAFNRAYLLFSIVFSLLVPSWSLEMTGTPAVAVELYLPAVLPVADNTAIAAPGSTPAATDTAGWSLAFVTTALYVSISFFLLARFAWNLLRIRKMARGAQSKDYQGARLILVDRNIPAHSFLRYIFMSRTDYNDSHTREALLTHELSHVQQKHSWDILFIELIRVFCWLNPVLYFYRKAIQLNHELQADDAVIRAHDNLRSYQHLLLDKIQQQTITPLTSSFNYFITKKRLAMMTRKPNSKRIACLQWAMLPLFVLAVLLFTGRTYAQTTPAGKKTAAPSITKTWDAKDTTKTRRAFGPQFPYGKGATPEQLERFNAVFKNPVAEGKWKRYVYTHQDVKWIKPIYLAMTKEQRSQYPDLHFMKPPAKQSPTAAQLREWANSSQYGVWIDNNRVDNATLANYKPGDFALVASSRLRKNAINYGNHYVQVDLTTHDWYDKNYEGLDDLLVVIEKVSFVPKKKAN